MVTVMLVNFRDNIIEVVDDKEELLARLRRLPSQIEADDIPDLVTLAQVRFNAIFCPQGRSSTPFAGLFHADAFLFPFQLPISPLHTVRPYSRRGDQVPLVPPGERGRDPRLRASQLPVLRG